MTNKPKIKLVIKKAGNYSCLGAIVKFLLDKKINTEQIDTFHWVLFIIEIVGNPELGEDEYHYRQRYLMQESEILQKNNVNSVDLISEDGRF